MTVKKSARGTLKSGRVRQKLRTRDALVEAAAELLREGREFSVADVADRARVGRTTAYRYFPSQAALLAHAGLWKLATLEHSEFEHVLDATTVEERVDALVAASDKSTRNYEKEYRSMLQLSLESDSPRELPVRTAFRRESLERALQDVEGDLGAERFERLVSALCMMVGIEALVVMQDICLLDPARAKEVKRWAAKVLLQAALDEAQAAPGSTVSRRKKA